MTNPVRPLSTGSASKLGQEDILVIIPYHIIKTQTIVIMWVLSLVEFLDSGVLIVERHFVAYWMLGVGHKNAMLFWVGGLRSRIIFGRGTLLGSNLIFFCFLHHEWKEKEKRVKLIIFVWDFWSSLFIFIL